MKNEKPTPQEFAARASAVLGGHGWQTRLSQAIGVDASTIRRWNSGTVNIPDYAIAILEFLEQTPTAFRPSRWLRP